MNYERSIDSGLIGSAQGASPIEGGSSAARISRDARDAQISSAHLSVSKNLEEVPATLLAERDRRRKRAKKRLLAVFAFVGILLLATTAAGALYYMNLQNRMTVTNEHVPEALRNTPTPAPQEPFNLVIFGIDKDFDEGWTGGHDVTEGARADAIIVARINPQTQEVWMVSIPRDARVELPGYGERKINAAYVYGGPQLAIEAVENVTGLEMDHFMSVNFWGFENIVDSLGGVEVDVPVAINDRKADATRPHRAYRIAPGVQTLDGEHALTFVRSRDSHVDGDFGRARMQQLFFRSLIEQMGDVPVTRIPGLANTLADNVVTDLTPLRLLQIARDMRGVSSDNFHTTTLPGEWRTPFVHLDPEGSAEVWRKFGVEPFADEEGDTEEAGLSPSEVSVTVRNGTTRAGIASEAAAVLRARGFTVDEIGNTENQSVYVENMVVYRDNREAAELIARFMPEDTRIVQSRGMFRFDTEALVILGTEWSIEGVPVAEVISQ